MFISRLVVLCCFSHTHTHTHLQNIVQNTVRMMVLYFIHANVVSQYLWGYSISTSTIAVTANDTDFGYKIKEFTREIYSNKMF